MTPKQRYERDLKNNAFQRDEAQAEAIEALDNLYHQFLGVLHAPVQSVSSGRKHFPSPSFIAKWLKNATKTKQDMPVVPKGLYLWGGVGRGKTYLMDTFFASLPTQRKMRVHFHRFMHRVHEELRQLHDVSDPLEQVADTFKSEAEIICFDEFFVSDITDAMILGTLFQALFTRGMILVATSNIPPQLLYRNGLQRARFLPAIAMIEENCHIINVDGGVDYRLRTLEQADIYHFPNDEHARENLERYYRELVSLQNKDKDEVHEIEINHRVIPVLNSSHGVLLATFEQLCQTMRSQNDYIELSQVYHTVILSDVKAMNRHLEDATRRFIALVDEFYERRVKLIISAEVALEDLYSGGQLEFEFQRTQSRLIEMQSQDYLSKEHLS